MNSSVSHLNERHFFFCYLNDDDEDILMKVMRKLVMIMSRSVKKIPTLQEGLKVLKTLNERAYFCFCYGHLIRPLI